MNQPIVPANTGDILYSTRVMLFITLLCMGYSLSRPTPDVDNERELLLLDTTKVGSTDKEWVGLPLWQRKASDKAVERYTKSQEKKWRRWNEAMFERTS